MKAYAPGAIAAEVDPVADAFVLLSEGHDPGWQARIDGRPAPLYRANHVLSAVFAPRGRYEIRWQYRPRSFTAGRAISMAFLL